MGGARRVPSDVAFLCFVGAFDKLEKKKCPGPNRNRDLLN